MTAASARAASPHFLPHRVLRDVLPAEMADALIDYAVANEVRFGPSAALYGGRRSIDPSVRNALNLGDLGPFAEPMAARVAEIRPGIERAFGIAPYTLARIEMDLTASGDGAHFVRHADTALGTARTAETRILTMVLYLHRRPRRFTGGALRIFALDGPEVLEVPPDHNTLACFPAFTPHAVERVSCPGGHFADARFAITISLIR